MIRRMSPVNVLRALTQFGDVEGSLTHRNDLGAPAASGDGVTWSALAAAAGGSGVRD
jgi:hypothetical protein